MEGLEIFGRKLIALACERDAGEDMGFYRDTFLNWYGCVVAGARREVVERAAGFYRQDEGEGSCRPLFREERLSASACVALDCLSSAAPAYDDIHFETTLHPAGPVIAAALGVARRKKVSGPALLQAIRVGMEAECRMARVMLGAGTGAAPSWYPTGLAGGIGGAAAAGNLLGLGEKEMEAALGLAAIRASGVRGAHEAMATFFVPAIAAESGYKAAGLAGAGFTCKLAALTGEMGLIRQVAPNPDLAGGLEGLGRDYICQDTSCKPYPLGFIAFAVIRCCQDFRKACPENRIRRICLLVSPRVARMGENPHPGDLYEAQISLEYIAARAIGKPEGIYTPLADEFSVEEELKGLLERTEVQKDEALTDGQARLRVVFEDGTEYEGACDHAPGTRGHLLGRAEIEEKFMRLVSKEKGEADAKKLLEQIRGMEEMEDVSPLFL